MKTFFHFPWCKSFPLTFLLFVISYHWWGWTTGAINWSGYQIKLNHLLNWVPIWSRLDHKTSPPNKEMYFNFIPNLIQCPTKHKVRYIYIIYIFKYLTWEILVPFICIITQMTRLYQEIIYFEVLVHLHDFLIYLIYKALT